MRIDTGSGTVRLHAPGDVVEVSESAAERILTDHPTAFEVAPASGPTPSRNAALPESAYVSRGSELLGRQWRSVVEDIDGGEIDHLLDELEEGERARAKPRQSVLKAIAARREG